MKIGIFYNIIRCALENGEIGTIAEGVQKLYDAGISYYEVYANLIIGPDEEKEMLEAMKTCGARVGSLYFKKELPDASRPSVDKLWALTKQKLEQCMRLGCRQLMPVISFAEADDQSRSVLAEYYKEAAELSEEYGVQMVFENSPYINTRCFSMEDIAAILKHSDKLGYLLDAGNYWFAKEDTLSAIDRYQKDIRSVHLKDILPETGSEAHENGGIRVHYTTVGQGVSGIRDTIQKMMKLGYDNTFTIEIENANPVLPSAIDSAAFIRKAENEMLLYVTAMKHHDRLFEYARDYEPLGPEVELKTLHMAAVASVMNTLSMKLDLDAHLQRLAIVTGIFHDIGRYEQIKRYHTFRDKDSVDHADLSCEVLEKDDFLADLPDEDRRMVLTAIRNHNKYAIEEGLEGDTLLLCKMIRDADKIDIFRVVSTDPFEVSYHVTAEELENSRISDKVYESMMHHELAKNTDKQYPLDYVLGCTSFVFDINFKEAKAITLEKNHYHCKLDTLTYKNPETKKRIDAVFAEVERHLQAQDD